MTELHNQQQSAKRAGLEARGLGTAREFRDLSHQILQRAQRTISRFDFLREVLKTLIGYSGCEWVELLLTEDGKRLWCELATDSNLSELRIAPRPGGFSASSLEHALWTGNMQESAAKTPAIHAQAWFQQACRESRFRSIALIPLVGESESAGFLLLKSVQPDYFTQETIDLYERLARNLGVAVANQRTQAALHERVKELICLYGIADIAGQPTVSITEILEGIIQLLPPAWQYPIITFGRIVLDGSTYSTPGFPEDGQRLTADIVVGGKCRGSVEVAFAERKPDLDEGPFLKEERSLIEAVARQIALIVERRQIEEERLGLLEQLRHADRLATIGKFAAGVAHELNEPLANILGLAQLAKKCPSLPEEVAEDLENIVEASLHSREVIRKLMTLARQTPAAKSRVSLNEAVEKGLSFFAERCSKAGIELERDLSSGLPEISADPAQLSQVLINLVANAVQAMPDGGRLTVRTLSRDDHLYLIVEDTGKGMSEEVLKQIFLPFFTTKDFDQGTGLGLTVVQSIVDAHRGKIQVSSHIDKGSRFEVELPVAPPVRATEGK
jgi:signal transduction histidine kinase